MPRSDFNGLALGTRLASGLGRARQKYVFVPYRDLAYAIIPPPAYSVRIKDLTRKELIQRLYSVKHAHCPVDGNNLPAQRSPPVKLECMSDEEIVATLHHPHSCLPPVRSCDTPNASETKQNYTPEELHQLTGCHRFCNYQHIISSMKDGVLLNTGKFPLSLGTYATILKESPQQGD
jgi:hypothetical protein